MPPKEEKKKRTSEQVKVPVVLGSEAKTAVRVLTMREWRKYVSKRGLWLTMDQIDKLGVNASLTLAMQVDNGTRSMDVKDGDIYPASVYFAAHKEEYKKLKTGCILGEDKYKTSPFNDRGDGLASIGTGDDYSMLWSDLEKMPSIIHYDDEEEGEDSEDDGEE
jgi:hypothetical protein